MTCARKKAWRTGAMLVLIITAIASCCPSMDDLNIDSTVVLDLSNQTVEKHFDISAGLSLNWQSDAGHDYMSLSALFVNVSDVERKMNKDARNTLSSGPRNIWKTYVIEYSASISAGGKNSIISSSSILKEWCAAICPAYYS
ncbi:MAG: hypothetical protein LBI74_09845 [Synergistaceae bacterium]|jgi:hypothetical protein|nr:hypothetical protein [Synergistaceae bacterium]